MSFSLSLSEVKARARRDSTQPGAWDEIWESRKDLADWDYLSHVVFKEIIKHLPPDRKALLFETGSGSGRISKRLSMLGYQAGQIDCSFSALQLSRNRMNNSGRFVAADIRKIPLRDQSHDVLWSSGVLEHFLEPELMDLFREFSRVLKPNGILISLVPYTYCMPYRLAKWSMERMGLWPYGREEPFVTLDSFCKAGGFLIEKEYTAAFSTMGIQNLQYIPGLKKIGRVIGKLACQIYDAGPLRVWDHCCSSLFGGYLLVNVARKVSN